jgi:hypothetical protein
LLPTGEVQLRDVFAAFAGFGIRSPAINSASFRLSAGGTGGSSSKQEDGSPAVFKPLMLEMDGFRWVGWIEMMGWAGWQMGRLADTISAVLMFLPVPGGFGCMPRPCFLLFASSQRQQRLRQGAVPKLSALRIRPLLQTDSHPIAWLWPSFLVLPHTHAVRRFVKLCREAGLFDDNFTSTGADIIFTKVKTKVSPAGFCFEGSVGVVGRV